MLVIDMPLEKLKEYNGISPRPSDIDDFWDNAKKEVDALGDEFELIPAEFQTEYADCYDLYFNGVGGSRIYAKYLKPKNLSTKAPAVLEFHGYSGNSQDWATKLSYVLQGKSVFALDCRGQGGKSEDLGSVRGNTLNGHIIRGAVEGKDKLHFKKIFQDTYQLSKIAMSIDTVDETKLIAKGGSQGGALALVCASLQPNVCEVITMFPFLSDYRRVWEMGLTFDAYLDINEYFRRFDPRHEKENEFFETLGYIDIQNLVHRIRGKVHMFTGLSDKICPASTQFAAYNKIVSEKEMYIYPDFGHEGLPGEHDISFKIIEKIK